MVNEQIANKGKSSDAEDAAAYYEVVGTHNDKATETTSQSVPVLFHTFN